MKRRLKHSRPAPGSDSRQRKEEGKESNSGKEFLMTRKRKGDKKRTTRKEKRGADANH